MSEFEGFYDHEDKKNRLQAAWLISGHDAAEENPDQTFKFWIYLMCFDTRCSKIDTLFLIAILTMST